MNTAASNRFLVSKLWCKQIPQYPPMIEWADRTVLNAGTHQGYGKHYQLLDGDSVTPLQKMIFVGEIFYILTLTLAKLSILCFYWRIFSSSTSIRLPIYILSGIVSMWSLAAVSHYAIIKSIRLLLTLPFEIFTTIFQCDPVSGFWNRTEPAGCNVDNHIYIVGIAIPNILTDVAFMALPSPYIWRMNRSRSHKIALTGVFLVGGL